MLWALRLKTDDSGRPGTYGARMTQTPSGLTLGEGATPAPALPRPARSALPLALSVWLGLVAYGLTNGTNGVLALNLSVWTAVLAALSIWVARWQAGTVTREGVTLLTLAVAFALSFTLRAAPDLLAALNALALMLALLLGTAALRFPGLHGRSVAGLLGTAFTGGLRLMYGPLVLLERFPWPRSRPAVHGPLARWGVGALLTLPVLLVFGSLLASADEHFAQVLSGLTRWDPGALTGQAFSVAFWVALSGGLIYPAVLALRPTVFPERTLNVARLGLVETGLPLAALAALFIVFLLTQLPYVLSGGALPDGVTFAGYIREGFGQLMTVAFLTLALLLSAHALTRADVRAGQPYRLLNLAVLLPLALVIASAANRWQLYTLAYGLSEIRVLGAAFLVWVVLALGWLAWLLWRGELRRFAYPALLMGFVTLLGTTVMDPGALIARVNIERQLAGVTNDLRRVPQQVSARELLNLGAGAVPVLVAHLDRVTRPCPPATCAESRQRVIDELHDRYDATRPWRAWNAAYARAHALTLTLPPRSPYRASSD